MDATNVVLSNVSADDFVECSRRHVKTKGKLFKKQILRFGSFSHPANPDISINVDRTFYETLKKNFDDRVCPIVQFPLVDDKNRHVEDPARNLGEVVDISADEFGINAYIDVRKNADDVGETILGASAKVGLNYQDTKTGNKVGPTLLHVAATNRPYLTDLEDYETVSASNADTEDDDVVLLLSSGDNTETHSEEESNTMTKEELIAGLSEYGIDVEAGQRALADVEGFAALSNVLGDDVVATPDSFSTAIVDLTNSLRERDEQIAEREERIQTLTATVQEAELSAATAKVEDYIAKGRILPAWKDDMIEMSMSAPERFETFLLPEEYATAELSEQGFTSVEDSKEQDPAERAAAEGARLAALVNQGKDA